MNRDKATPRSRIVTNTVMREAFEEAGIKPRQNHIGRKSEPGCSHNIDWGALREEKKRRKRERY